MKNWIAGCLLGLCIVSSAQETDEVVTLTLDDCIRTALSNNISLQKAENNALIAKSNKTQALMSFLPSLQAQWNYNLLFGTFWDQIAAKQVSQQYSSTPNLNSSMTLFNGFSRNFNERSKSASLEAAELAIESSKQSTESSVLIAYLAIILDRENIKISERRIELLQAQRDREEKRISVGVGDLETFYNFRAQVANERLVLTRLKNKNKSDILSLIQLLQLDVTQEYDFLEEEASDESLITELDPYDVVLAESFNASPSIKSAEANHMASVYNYKMAKSTVMPTLSVYGEIGSRYSSAGAQNPETLQGEKASYLTQMDWNRYHFVGFTFGVPIFTRFVNSGNIQRSKLTMLNAELDKRQANQTLTNTVQKAYLDLTSSQESYQSAQENLAALDQSFEFVRKRYETGNTDFYTYLESLNNKNRAEIELVNARYNIIFFKKVLSIYRAI